MAKQLLLFPDQRPLVEALGAEFFQRAPTCPGVYLMRDSADEVLYVGKAKNLRERLGSYRVANPDRIGRRHLRLLRAVKRIDFQECDSESSALAKETALLRNLRPPFNRVGTWPASPQYLTWRFSETAIDLRMARTLDPGWSFVGPLGSGARFVRDALLRLLWSAFFPERGLAGMPAGWFHGRCGQSLSIPLPKEDTFDTTVLARLLAAPWSGQVNELIAWLDQRQTKNCGLFEAIVRAADLEVLKDTASKRN